jgi:putative glutamine amidotransferase
MKKPLIAILVKPNYWTAPQGPTAGNGTSHRSVPDICEAVRSAGGQPMLLQQGSPDVGNSPDAMIFPGGADIHPALYGQHPDASVDLAWVDESFDRFQLEWARWALTRQIPVLGICRGMQVLNVAAGGTLIQDIPSSGTNLDHAPARVLADPSLRPDPVHPIGIDLQSHLGQLLGINRLMVNSIHHQSLHYLGEGFQSVAWADDGVVEAIEKPHAPWQRGVQFHPEDMREQPVFQRLFDRLVEDATLRSGRTC